jgi:4-amino-4-deoxychorismate lyase
MTGLSLIETMRFAPETGILRLTLHMNRLKNSARKLGLPGAEQAREKLEATLAGQASPLRVRLELFADGRIDIATAPYQPLPDGTVWKVRIASTAIRESTDPLVRHKTSERALYDRARAEFSREEADEILILNERGEMTEGTITSLFIDDGTGLLLTPPLSAGCLAGVLRTELLCSRRARVARVTPGDLHGRIFHVGNSLRGLIPAVLQD